MGRKDRKSPKQNPGSGVSNQEELLSTLGDFTRKENWDQFFKLRGSDDSFEWYAEWPQVKDLLKTRLLLSSTELEPSENVAAEDLSILVPGCGNSRLSEHLYDAGFTKIMNIDFSKVVIADMLRRNVRERPRMKWLVRDMTDMQFEDESFDAIVDKGGLDALMEPEHGFKIGNLYLSEVKRVLVDGGKFICLTLAESHVLDLLFPKFRFGWKISLYGIAPDPSPRNHKLQTFMVIAEKDDSTKIFDISSFIDQSSIVSHHKQVSDLSEALDREKNFRAEYSNGSDILYSLKDLKLGTKGNIAELDPGRRVTLILGEPEISHFFYKAVLLDAKDQAEPFIYHFGVFMVPRTRTHDWLFSSEEGQWLVVASSRASRLLMILLDSSHAIASMQGIKTDLSPLVLQLSPANNDGAQIPFLTASDGTKQRKIIHQVASELTGEIIVEDVIYEKLDDEINRRFPNKDLIFRRLTFQRSENLVQSEAILSNQGLNEISNEIEEMKPAATIKSGKKGKKKKSDVNVSEPLVSSRKMNVDHSYLAGSYHNGIISGLMLISTHLEEVVFAGSMVKTVVIGLGAGLLPMFLRNCIPFLDIEVIELDPVILEVARGYFGFREDLQLKVHIADGIKFMGDIENLEASEVEIVCTDEENGTLYKKPVNGYCEVVNAQRKMLHKIDILIVDVDSEDAFSGLACPAVDFVEESFLSTAKNLLSDKGLFIINLVSRSSAVKVPIYSRLKKIFVNLYSLQIEEDVNEVIFALKTDIPICDDNFSDSFDGLSRLLELEKQDWSESIIKASKLIRRLE